MVKSGEKKVQATPCHTLQLPEKWSWQCKFMVGLNNLEGLFQPEQFYETEFIQSLYVPSVRPQISQIFSVFILKMQNEEFFRK